MSASLADLNSVAVLVLRGLLRSTQAEHVLIFLGGPIIEEHPTMLVFMASCDTAGLPLRCFLLGVRVF